MKRAAFVLASLLLASAAYAGVGFVDLGTGAPPATVQGIPVQPFDQVVQAAIPDVTLVGAIPGSPIGGTLTLNEQVDKRTVGITWGTWSHGYTGPVYYSGSTGDPDTRTLTLPAGTTAFYLYVEPNSFSTWNIECETASGVSSGPIPVTGASGANGFGFYATYGDTLTSITVTADPGALGFAIGEFGASDAFAYIPPQGIPTLSVAGFAALALALGFAAFFLLRRRRTA